MSRNRKYIEQFNRNAGKPSDFDSLFDFEDKKLIAKRRIRLKSSHSHFAAICSAAAVIGIAAFAALSFINEKGMASDKVLSKCDGITPSADFTEYLEEETALSLSSLIGHFDYYAAGNIGETISGADRSFFTDAAKETFDTRAVIRLSVVSKFYSAADGMVYYTIRPLEYYADDYFMDILKNMPERIILRCPVYSDGEELQIGSEYILPVCKTGSDVTIDESNGILEVIIDSDGIYNALRKTEKGWLIYMSGCGGSSVFNKIWEDSEWINDDLGGSACYHLEESDEEVTKKLRAYLEGINDVTFYHAVIDELEGSSRGGYYNLNSILPKAQFEKASYGTLADGNPDRTLLVLDNERYFSLMPYLSGGVTFAGENERGDLFAALEITYYSEPEAESYAKTVLISGFEALNVSTGDSIDENTVIGECNENPIYMRFIDNNGLPMEIELDDNTAETTVIMADE
ncbi:MAG: hypothetical protein MSJ26_04705 [Oscillospiraceae bacterium]|nr:hypothetical protein [Oscillospiraceae bacterium]